MLNLASMILLLFCCRMHSVLTRADVATVAASVAAAVAASLAAGHSASKRSRYGAPECSGHGPYEYTDDTRHGYSCGAHAACPGSHGVASDTRPPTAEPERPPAHAGHSGNVLCAPEPPGGDRGKPSRSPSAADHPRGDSSVLGTPSRSPAPYPRDVYCETAHRVAEPAASRSNEAGAASFPSLFVGERCGVVDWAKGESELVQAQGKG